MENVVLPIKQPQERSFKAFVLVLVAGLGRLLIWSFSKWEMLRTQKMKKKGGWYEDSRYLSLLQFWSHSVKEVRYVSF